VVMFLSIIGLFLGNIAGLVLLPLSILLLLALIPLYIRRNQFCFALTDKRILTVSGILGKTITSFEHRDITAVSIGEPFFMRILGGNIIFTVPSYGLGRVTWFGIRNPHEVYQYVSQVRDLAIKYSQLDSSLTQASMIGSAVAANLSQTKICWNCHGITTASAAYCRNCGVRQP
jgi:ribosomal protein L40E